MSKERKEIDRVRNCIAGAIYNDSLPTNLVTNVLMDICFMYDIYRKAQDDNAKQQALEGIKADVDMINSQNFKTGASCNIIYPKDDSLDGMRDIGETIMMIYAIPYLAGLNMDYVGYAYGVVMRKMENNRLYDSYRPDEFLNQCSEVVLHCTDETIAESVMVAFENSAGALNYLMDVEAGKTEGDPVGVRNLVLRRFETIASEVEAMTGEHINTRNDVAEALYITSCINASIAFGNKEHLEKYREMGIFKDDRADKMTIVHY